MQPEVEKTGAPAPEHAAPPAESEADDALAVLARELAALLGARP